MQPYLGLSFILAVCLAVVVVIFGNFNKRVYPFLLYGIAAGMVLMFSLAGPYLTGSDIHLEYCYANLRAGVDVVPPWIGIPLGASFNKEDKEVRQYIFDYKLFPVASDIYGTDFTGELVGWRDGLQEH